MSGFVLTLRLFERRLSMPREKMRLPQYLPKAPNVRGQTRECVVNLAIDPVETGFLAPECRETQSYDPGR